MNEKTEFWDGTYCMVCQDNYGTPENTAVRDFLCVTCYDYASRNLLHKRISLLEELASRFAHPSMRPAETEGKNLMDSSEQRRRMLLDENVLACEDCNTTPASWFISGDNGELIAGPKCDSCYLTYHNAVFENGENDGN